MYNNRFDEEIIKGLHYGSVISMAVLMPLSGYLNEEALFASGALISMVESLNIYMKRNNIMFDEIENKEEVTLKLER